VSLLKVKSLLPPCVFSPFSFSCSNAPRLRARTRQHRNFPFSFRSSARTPPCSIDFIQCETDAPSPSPFSFQLFRKPSSMTFLRSAFSSDRNLAAPFRNFFHSSLPFANHPYLRQDQSPFKDSLFFFFFFFSFNAIVATGPNQCVPQCEDVSPGVFTPPPPPPPPPPPCFLFFCTSEPSFLSRVLMLGPPFFFDEPHPLSLVPSVLHRDAGHSFPCASPRAARRRGLANTTFCARLAFCMLLLRSLFGSSFSHDTGWPRPTLLRSRLLTPLFVQTPSVAQPVPTHHQYTFHCGWQGFFFFFCVFCGDLTSPHPLPPSLAPPHFVSLFFQTYLRAWHVTRRFGPSRPIVFCRSPDGGKSASPMKVPPFFFFT